ncbi:L-lactate dehydrogenase, partial [Listeria seeligeri]|nr:L-lactate dehydrogenase [Listeria seeligeri]
IIDAVLSDAKQVFPLAVFSEKMRIYIGQPAVIGRKGITSILEPPLTNEEQLSFESSANIIRNAVNLF